jgi:hypothetical protein
MHPTKFLLKYINQLLQIRSDEAEDNVKHSNSRIAIQDKFRPGTHASRRRKIHKKVDLSLIN